MQLLEVSGAVRPIYGSLGVKRFNNKCEVCGRNFTIETVGGGGKTTNVSMAIGRISHAK